MNTHVFPAPPGSDPRRAQMDQRIDRTGWGLFFIVIGALWLVPEPLPEGTWLTVIGGLLVAVNGWRLASGLPLHLWTSIVGAFSLLAGVGVLSGMHLPLLAMMLIAIGIATLAEPLVRRRS